MRKGNVECFDTQTEGRFESIYLIATRAILETVIVLLIVGTNAFIVFAIARYQRRRRAERSAPSNASVRFALNLAVSDLFVGVSTLCYLSSKYICSVMDTLSNLKYLCLGMFVMIVCAHTTSAYTIVAIAVDRYIAVVHALRYRELMNTRMSRIMIVAVWVSSVCLSTPVFYWNQWSASSNICEELLVLPVGYLPVMAVLSHCLIMGIVGGFHRRIHHEALASNERNRSRVSCISTFESRQNIRFRGKSAKVLLLVTACYIICWTPITVVMFIRGFGTQTDLVDVIYNYSFTFMNINYLFNPIVYSWMNPAVRSAILDVLRSLKCKIKRQSNCDTINIDSQGVYPSVSTVYSIS